LQGLSYFLSLPIMSKYFTYVFLVIFSGTVLAQETDTSRVKVTRQWTLSKDFTDEVTVPVDTMFSLFNRNKSADKYSPFNAYLGNYGLPLYQLNFFDRPTDPEMFVYNYYYPFMHLPDNALFLNTKVPFTELLWTFGAPRNNSEQTFRVRHSQNINRYFNVGLIFDVVYSVGQYSHQLSDNKDFLLHSSYTREKYKVYFATGLNYLNSYENGGIINGTGLAGKSLSDLNTLPVNLVKDVNNAKNNLKNKNILIVQRYTLGEKANNPKDTLNSSLSDKQAGLTGTISHILTWESNKRTYTDKSPLSGFYDSVYINNALTHDSLFSRVLKNTVRFDLNSDATRKFRIGAGFGIRNELSAYSQIVPTHDLSLSDTINWGKSSNALLGKLFNNIGEAFGWVASGEFYITGFRAGDFSINGEINNSFKLKKGVASVSIFGGLINTEPSFWYDQWGSNNFEWKNNFLKELRLNAGANFIYPGRREALRFNFSIINNYIDFGTGGFPSQNNGAISVAAVSGEKEFILWKLHLSNNILLQKSSNSNVLDLPLIAVKSAFFIEHNFFFKFTNGHLNTQLGVDVFYNSSYYGYAYMPATGRYYRQNSILTGNYPYLNAFLNIKLKRTRIVIMYDHVNSGMMGYNYYMVPSYPMNIRMFKYGLAWTFYD
jgi:hypothetical protein